MKRNILFILCSLFIFHSAFAQLPVANFTASNNPICPGTCTDFINLSTNATSYQWIFQGAAPSVSTDTNPTPVCYQPGSFDVTLIATNSFGSDTLLIPNYMVVYPYSPSLGILVNGDTLFATLGFVSYQWYQNLVMLAGETNSSYIVTNYQAGDAFWVEATDTNNCAVDAILIPDLHAGLHEFSFGNTISIFPNPVSENLFIKSPLLTEATEIKIYNTIGEVVLSSQYKTSLDVHTIQSGMYWIEVSVTGKIFRSKFLKY